MTKCNRCGKDNPAEIHTCSPLALRLADSLQAGADDPMWADHCEMSKRTANLSAAELRRLSAENAELLEALIWALDQMPEPTLKGEYTNGYRKARAAIAKATGEQA